MRNKIKIKSLVVQSFLKDDYLSKISIYIIILIALDAIRDKLASSIIVFK